MGQDTILYVCYVCVCVSVSIMAKGPSGKRTVHEGNVGGKSTLRRFHCVVVTLIHSGIQYMDESILAVVFMNLTIIFAFPESFDLSRIGTYPGATLYCIQKTFATMRRISRFC